MANLYICCLAANCEAKRCLFASPHVARSEVGPCYDVKPFIEGGVRVWDEPCDMAGNPAAWVGSTGV